MLDKLISKARGAKSAPSSTTDHNIILDVGNRIMPIEGISSYHPETYYPNKRIDFPSIASLGIEGVP